MPIICVRGRSRRRLSVAALTCNSPRALLILGAAPTPAGAAALTLGQLRVLLKRAERLRCGIEAEVEQLREIFRAHHLHHLPQVEQAIGHQTAALLRQLDAAGPAGYMGAFAALRIKAPRAHYDRRRAAGERHTAALRSLFGRLLGCLFRCLQTRAHYDPDRAFTTPQSLAAQGST